MSKFTFVYQNKDIFTEEVTSKVTMETDAESLSELFEEFECFLKGAGYHFEGKIDLVNDDDFTYDDDEDDDNDNSIWDDEYDKMLSPSSAAWPFPTGKAPE